MARKKATSYEKKKNLLERVAPISQQVEIETVFLSESRTRRGPDTMFEGDELSVNIKVSNIKFGTQESARILIMPSFELTVTKEGEEESAPALSIEASFVLVYVLASVKEFDKSAIRAFAATNGVLNAWSYWREFVQNTTARMGLPPIAVPLLRL
jgi:hypothetical protein